MRASGIVFAHDPRRRAEDGDNLLKVGRNGRTSLGEYGANGKLTVSCRDACGSESSEIRMRRVKAFEDCKPCVKMVWRRARGRRERSRPNSTVPKYLRYKLD